MFDDRQNFAKILWGVLGAGGGEIFHWNLKSQFECLAQKAHLHSPYTDTIGHYISEASIEYFLSLWTNTFFQL